ncbi:MAG: type 4b pilus protein PilO2 [Leptospirales bacterium]
MAQSVRIGKKTYAVGLSWGPLSSDRPLRPQAIEKARQSQNGLYVIYGEVEPHVGHCDATNGVKAKMAVLAPLVAEIWPSNTLLAVTIDEQTTIGFQILNGIIFDDVCGTSEEIRTWFDGLIGEHKWEHGSSPWGVGEHQKTALLDSLGDRRLKTPKLRSVNESRGAAIKIGLLVMVSLIGFLAVSKIIQNRREMAARLAMLSRHVVRTVIPPVQIVPVGSFVEVCRDAMNRIPAFPAGWKVRSVSCRPDRIRITWGRDVDGSGTIRDLESVLDRRVELEEGGAVRSDFPLSISEYGMTVDRLPDLIEEKKDFVSVLERYGLQYGMDNGSVLPGTASVPEEGSGFSVELPDLPDGRLLSDLSNVSGLSVNALEWTGKSQWILKGELKHAPIGFRKSPENRISGVENHNRDGDRLPGSSSHIGPGGKFGPTGVVGNRQPGSLSGVLPGGSGIATSENTQSGDRPGRSGTSLPPVHIPGTEGSSLSGDPSTPRSRLPGDP